MFDIPSPETKELVPKTVGLMEPVAVLFTPSGAPSVPDSLPTRLMALQKQCQKQGGFPKRVTKRMGR